MNDINKLGLIYSLTNFLLAIIYAYAQAYSKRGYLLGVSLSETMGEDKRVKNILKIYKIETLFLGVISSMGIYLLSFILEEVGLSLMFVLITILVGLIPLIIQNKKLKELSEEDVNISKNRVVSIEFSKHKIVDKRKILLLYSILLLVILAFGIKIHLAYPTYPDKLVMHMSFNGNIDYVEDKTYLTVQSVTIMSIAIRAIYMATNLIIISSKARISPDKPRESLENLIKVRRLRTYYCLISTLLMVLLFQVGVADFMKTGRTSLAYPLLIVTIVFAVVPPLIIGKNYSVDGSRKGNYSNLGFEEDDKYRVLGSTLYYNPNDPSLFVEKRVGVGYTLNIGIFKGKLIVGLIILIIIFAIMFLIIEGL